MKTWLREVLDEARSTREWARSDFAEREIERIRLAGPARPTAAWYDWRMALPVTMNELIARVNASWDRLRWCQGLAPEQHLHEPCPFDDEDEPTKVFRRPANLLNAQEAGEARPSQKTRA